jgi:hypothetical protein
MTQTVQPRSWTCLSERGKDLTVSKPYKPETEDNLSLMLSLFDSLNDLSEKINRLNYILQRREIERILSPKGKGGGEKNEN